MGTAHRIPGYTYGEPQVEHSPVTIAELDALKETLLWTDSDDEALRMAGDVLADQVGDVVATWYDYVAAHPHLVAYFGPPGGAPDSEYLERVRARFEQWILDTCRRPYDGVWLDYQQEIALRHTPAKKDQTDHVDAVDRVPLHYIIAFIYPITATIRPFLSAKGHGEEDVERMYQAWFKAVTLQVALWSRPYAREGDW
ncbi:protoglobin domain-containing protein [Saccharopolyspora sp. NPDC003752]